MSVIDELKKKLTGGDGKATKDGRPTALRLSTSQTLINLALTGDPSWGLEAGNYYLFVGDSGAAKTFIVLAILAEAANNGDFDGYRLIYDAPERGARMSFKKFYGKRMAERVEFKYSERVEEMYFNLDDLMEEKRPFIYVVDSETALVANADFDKFQEVKTAFKKGKDTTGTMGMSKPKQHSAFLRLLPGYLARSGSILILVSQTRQNVGWNAMYQPKTRAGGDAMKFYATDELWFTHPHNIMKMVNGQKRKIGTEVKVTIKKNRDTGVEPVIPLHHYHSVGLDDVGAMVQFLVDEKRWKSAKEDGTGKITASDFDFTGSREQVVRYVEDNNKERELRRIVREVWDDVMAQCAVQRKSRYK